MLKLIYKFVQTLDKKNVTAATYHKLQRFSESCLILGYLFDINNVLTLFDPDFDDIRNPSDHNSNRFAFLRAFMFIES